MQRLRPSDPGAVLPSRNPKHASNCREIHLAQRKIDYIDGFENFTNLEVLWLNDNRITALEGLDDKFRLRELYIHNNQLSTLEESSLPHMRFLEKLTLFKNQLHDLHAVLGIIKRLRRLKYLELWDNPVAEETNYRLHVIKQMPWLDILDRHVVTEEERAAAAALPEPRLDASSLHDVDEEEEAEKEREMRTHVRTPEVDACLVYIRERTATQRLCPKEEMQLADPRRTGQIHEEDFFEALHVMGYVLSEAWKDALRVYYRRTDKTWVAQELRRTGTKWNALSSDGRIEVPNWHKTLTMNNVDTTSGLHSKINYLLFCRDVEPRAGGRDADTVERQLMVDWKKPVDSVSLLTHDLRREVKKIRTLRAEQEERERKAIVGGSSSSPSRETFLGTETRIKEVFPCGIDSWSMSFLRGCLQQSDAENSGTISVQALRQALHQLADRGTRVHEDSKEAFEDFVMSVCTLPDDIGEDDEPAVAPDNATVEWRSFASAIEQMKDPEILAQTLPPDAEVPEDEPIFVRFRKLSGEEAAARAHELYDSASRLQQKLSLLKEDDPARDGIQTEIRGIMQRAVCLERLGQSGTAGTEEEKAEKSGAESSTKAESDFATLRAERDMKEAESELLMTFTAKGRRRGRTEPEPSGRSVRKDGLIMRTMTVPRDQLFEGDDGEQVADEETQKRADEFKKAMCMSDAKFERYNKVTNMRRHQKTSSRLSTAVVSL